MKGPQKPGIRECQDVRGRVSVSFSTIKSKSIAVQARRRLKVDLHSRLTLKLDLGLLSPE